MDVRARLVVVALGVFVGLLGTPLQAGTVVVANDEWTLSDSGFGSAPDAGTFALNVASLFTGGGTGNFLVYSGNFGLTGSNLQSTMTGAGHTWTKSTAVTFDLATLSAYDGVFLAGYAADNTVLTNYVNAGGNVYLAGGTGVGGEAALWNSFLNAFGLEFASSYNGIGGVQTISSSHPLFSGVDALYQNNGNSISDLAPLDPSNAVLVSVRGNGLYAIWQSGTTPAVPVPGAILLGALGAGLVTWMRNRRVL